MVMVRCTGVWALVRWSAWERATARSIDVAVASRWAAAMKASASCELSVPSAWRSRAAMRANILSSVMRDPLRSSLASHGARLGILGDVVAGVLTQDVVDPLEFDDRQRGVLERSDERFDGVALGLAVGVRTRQQHRRTRGYAGRQGKRIDLVGFHDRIDVAGVQDRAEPLWQFLGHGALGADLVDRREPGRQRGGVAVRPYAIGDDVQVSARKRLKEAQRVDLWGADIGIRGQRHRVNRAFADGVHGDACLVG